jgi:hypothetical protein
MPRRDGTGPYGMGPGTGFGRGRCFGRGRGRGLFYGLLLPLAAGVARDLMNPNGLLRGTTRALLTALGRQRLTGGRAPSRMHATKVADAQVVDSRVPPPRKLNASDSHETLP